jgi:DNA ligase (NAD+)
MFSEEQKEILKHSEIELSHLTEEMVDAIAKQQIDQTDLSDEELVEFLEVANALYRGGAQIISDDEYDFTFLAELRLRHPQHPYLHQVEPEAAFVGKTVELPARMLSTDKAYTKKKIEQWAANIKKKALSMGKEVESLEFRVTPKLDGFAAYDDGDRLYTRGDGRRGTDITRVFERGLSVANDGPRGLGPGEIVVDRPYFDHSLQSCFENPRNFQTSVIREKELEGPAEKAIKDKAVVFYPFSLLPSWHGTWQQLMENFEGIVTDYRSRVPFDVDGVILEITDEELKNELGSTRHHHRWQIAYKENLEAAHVKVIDVFPQTSRSGRINPVARVEPTRLSGALIQRATAHHYKMVMDKKIGPGAIIELTRSGEVIPKIGNVIEPAEPVLPESCPSCGSAVDWEGDYLYCTNTLECPAQIANTMEHFFKMLRHVDLFGSATIQKLYENGVRSVDQIYQLKAVDFEGRMGFGPKQSENLEDQLTRSRSERIEDWRFLTAFGVFRLGPGNCEKLLGHYPLEEVFNLTEEQVINVEGFAEKTAKIVVEGLNRIKPLFDKLYALGFNLERTPLVGQKVKAESPISGMQIVFTGVMTHGSRDDMEKEAKALGAKVGKSVTGKTTMLVTGENVGETKMNEARNKGVKIVTEEEYLRLLKGETAAAEA